MATSGSALVVRSFGGLSHLGTIEAYITAAGNIPMLTQEEESGYARRLKESGDIVAAQALINSHLRLVISIARGYLGYGLPHADLIQEGNIGLMRAVKRFDPDRGVRLVSYAMYWIKAAIHEYILKNWRLVKVSTSRAQKKLFFNLRSYQNQIEQIDGKPASVANIAEHLDVSEKNVVDMQLRFSSPDVSYDAPVGNEDDLSYAPERYLSSSDTEPFHRRAMGELEILESVHLKEAVAKLDPRSRRIIETRWLSNDTNGKSSTLHDLAREFSISAERVRQIEVAALKKLRNALADYSDLVLH